MKRTYVWRDGEFVEITPPKARKLHFIQEDTMGALRHPATGEMIDSKSKFRQATKNSGCVELGDQQVKQEMQYASGLRDDLSSSIEQLQRSGRLMTDRTIPEQMAEMDRK